MKINEGFLHSMQDAMKLLRARGPKEATAALQRALGAHAQPTPQPNTDAPAVTYPGTFTTHTFANAAVIGTTSSMCRSTTAATRLRWW